MDMEVFSARSTPVRNSASATRDLAMARAFLHDAMNGSPAVL